MLSRRSFLRSGAASAAFLGSGVSAAWAANAPGVTDTEIKIGQTMPYSGPASSVMGMIGRADAAYFKMINEMGGVNGRRINLMSLDDGYNPSKTVEQVRRLVEQEQVAFIFNSAGTSPNLAIQPYLNDNKVPQIFVPSGSSRFGDPRHFPWTIGCWPSFQTEGHVYAKHILATKPDARIGVLYQNDSVGKEYLTGLRDGLGVNRAATIVKEVSYEVGDPTVDSQIIEIQAAGPDTIFLAALPRAAGQAIRKIYDLGWAPTRYVMSGAVSIDAVLRPAGLEKSKGLMSAGSFKDVTDPRWKDDEDVKAYAGFIAKYMSPNDYAGGPAAVGYFFGALLVDTLRRCGDDLSRDNIMRQATNIKDLELPLLLPGIKVNTSPDNYFPIRQMRLLRFDGVSWEYFGDVVGD
jgi:branched-chain amino acid transport system substrate-binding protein